MSRQGGTEGGIDCSDVDNYPTARVGCTVLRCSKSSSLSVSPRGMCSRWR